MAISSSSRFGTVIAYVRTMAVFIAVWWAVSVWTSNLVLLPTPFAVIEAIVDLARDLELFVQAGISLGRMMISLALAKNIRDSSLRST